MNYLKIAQAIGDYWNSNRRVGHTTAMMQGVGQSGGVIVVVADQRQAQDIKKEFGTSAMFVSLGALESPMDLAGRRFALVMDHHAMAILLAGMIATVKLAQSQTVFVGDQLTQSQALVRSLKLQSFDLAEKNTKLQHRLTDAITGMILLGVALLLVGAWVVAAS
jgi:hypothetical protein